MDDTANDGGFTLLELCVVVMIIGVLVALAIPTFMGSSERAHDTRAKSNVATALKAAKAIGTAGDYTDATPEALQAEEASLAFVDATVVSPDPSVISESVPDAEAVTVVVAAQSDSGTCFFAQDSALEGTVFAAVQDVPCDAAHFVDVPADEWLPKW